MIPVLALASYSGFMGTLYLASFFNPAAYWTLPGPWTPRPQSRPERRQN